MYVISRFGLRDTIPSACTQLTEIVSWSDTWEWWQNRRIFSPGWWEKHDPLHSWYAWNPHHWIFEIKDYRCSMLWIANMAPCDWFKPLKMMQGYNLNPWNWMNEMKGDGDAMSAKPTLALRLYKDPHAQCSRNNQIATHTHIHRQIDTHL
jgi:hypothetical protein